MWLKDENGKFAGSRNLATGTYKVIKRLPFWRKADKLVHRVAKIYAVQFVALALLMGFYVLGTADSKVVVAYQDKIVADNSIPPIMLKIAKCESGNSHYDKNGQVLINKTQDIGKYQIHTPIWGKKASELNLNLANEADNEAMALWIYRNRGTVDWVHSSKCWNK